MSARHLALYDESDPEGDAGTDNEDEPTLGSEAEYFSDHDTYEDIWHSEDDLDTDKEERAIRADAVECYTSFDGFRQTNTDFWYRYRLRTRKPSLRSLPDLKMLLESPRSIIYEVFRWLRPIDLVSVMSSSRYLNTMLAAPSAATWKWAAFMYNRERCCDHCGWQFPQSLCIPKQSDFGLLRKLCRACRYVTLIRDNVWEGEDPLIIELIPYTTTRIASLYALRSRRKRKYFYKEDIKEMPKRLKAYQNEIDDKIPGAKKRYCTFIAERKAHARKISQNIQAGWDWLCIEQGREYRAFLRGQKRRKEQIKQKCLELDYLSEDIDEALGPRYGISDKPLTEKGWSYMRKEIEAAVERAERVRMYSEREDIEERRLEVAQNFYGAYLASLPLKDTLKIVLEPWAFAYLRPIMEVVTLTRLGKEVTEDDFFAISAALPQAMVAFTNMRMDYYRSLIPGIPWHNKVGSGESQLKQSRSLMLLPTDCIPLSIYTVHRTRTPPYSFCKKVDPLPLVVTVFRCGGQDCASRQPILGSDPAMIHQRFRSNEEKCPKTREYWEKASEFARSLVILAGLNPDDAKTEDMDNVNVFFTRRMRSKKLAFSWRDAMTYEMEIKRDAPWSWRILQQQELSEYITVTNPADLLHEWVCLHCTELHPDEKLVAIAHVQSKHRIQGPKVNIDVIRFPLTSLPPFHAGPANEEEDEDAPKDTITPSTALRNEQRTYAKFEKEKKAANKRQHPGDNHEGKAPPKKPRVIPKPKECRFTCSHCPASDTPPRLFKLDGVKAHIAAKHGIAKPGQKDYKWV
ncbi:hypothetical protein AX16_004883 [Volvariella volvacea WC 439]|nr:hypothetical protein AX16_004883 [Volvariella volvacea WC 439]